MAIPHPDDRLAFVSGLNDHELSINQEGLVRISSPDEPCQRHLWHTATSNAFCSGGMETWRRLGISESYGSATGWDLTRSEVLNGMKVRYRKVRYVLEFTSWLIPASGVTPLSRHDPPDNNMYG